MSVNWSLNDNWSILISVEVLIIVVVIPDTHIPLLILISVIVEKFHVSKGGFKEGVSIVVQHVGVIPYSTASDNIAVQVQVEVAILVVTEVGKVSNEV